MAESKGYKSLSGALLSLGDFWEITLEPMGVDADVTLELFEFIGGFQLVTRQSRNNCRCSFNSGQDIRQGVVQHLSAVSVAELLIR